MGGSVTNMTTLLGFYIRITCFSQLLDNVACTSQSEAPSDEQQLHDGFLAVGCSGWRFVRTVAVDVKAGGYVAVAVTLDKYAGGCALHKAVPYIKHNQFHNRLHCPR